MGLATCSNTSRSVEANPGVRESLRGNWRPVDFPIVDSVHHAHHVRLKLPILVEAVDETLDPIRDRVVLVSGDHPEKVHMRRSSGHRKLSSAPFGDNGVDVESYPQHLLATIGCYTQAPFGDNRARSRFGIDWSFGARSRFGIDWSFGARSRFGIDWSLITMRKG